MDSPVKEYRQKSGVSQRQFAQFLGVPPSVVVSLELQDEEYAAESPHIQEVFDKLALLTGMPAKLLGNKHNQSIRESRLQVKREVSGKLKGLVLDKLGYKQTQGLFNTEHQEKLDSFLEFITDRCQCGFRSPITVIRGLMNITQRELALAVEISPLDLIALEKGDSPLYSERVLEFLVQGFPKRHRQQIEGKLTELHTEFLDMARRLDDREIKDLLLSLRGKISF